MRARHKNRRAGRTSGYDGPGELMDTRYLIEAIDAEISRLQQVKSLLSGPGRAQTTKLYGAVQALKPTKRRKLSASARAKIAAAQRARWAKFRKSAK
jgi:hypothetical protein